MKNYHCHETKQQSIFYADCIFKTHISLIYIIACHVLSLLSFAETSHTAIGWPSTKWSRMSQQTNECQPHFRSKRAVHSKNASDFLIFSQDAWVFLSPISLSGSVPLRSFMQKGMQEGHGS